MQAFIPYSRAENANKHYRNDITGLDHHHNGEGGNVDGQDVGMSGDDYDYGAGDDVGDWHFGVLLVEEGVNEPPKHPGHKGLSPDKSDGAVKLCVLDSVVDLVWLFKAIRDRRKEYIF